MEIQNGMCCDLWAGLLCDLYFRSRKPHEEELFQTLRNITPGESQVTKNWMEVR